MLTSSRRSKPPWLRLRPPTAPSTRPSARRSGSSGTTAPSLVLLRDGRLLHVSSAPGGAWRRIEIDRERRTARIPAGVELDLGATAKALAADRAARAAAETTADGILVSLGGDVAVAGDPPDEGWSVGLADDHAARRFRQTDQRWPSGRAAWPLPGRVSARGRPLPDALITSSIRAPGRRRRPPGERSASPPPLAWTRTQRARRRSCSATRLPTGWHSGACPRGWCETTARSCAWPAGRARRRRRDARRRQRDRALVRHPRLGRRLAAAADGRPRAGRPRDRPVAKRSLAQVRNRLDSSQPNAVRDRVRRPPRPDDDRRRLCAGGVQGRRHPLRLPIPAFMARLRRSRLRPVARTRGDELAPARIGYRAWRAVHWLAYASWPFALVHGFGTGSGSRFGWLVLITLVCAGAVGAALAARLLRSPGAVPLRAGAGAAAVVFALLAVAWYRAGRGSRAGPHRQAPRRTSLAATPLRRPRRKPASSRPRC